MKFYILLAFIAIGSSVAQQLTFEQWEAMYSKKLDASRRAFYRINFAVNLKEVEEHNARDSSYKLGLNEYSHLPTGDFISTRCKTNVPTDILTSGGDDVTLPVLEAGAELTAPVVGAALTVPPPKYPFYSYTVANVPPEVDWSGLMQPVQNQGSCGACWAFATMGFLEGMMRIRDPSLPNFTFLSPQYLIDCATDQKGCEGGWPAKALRYLKSEANVAPKISDYPYLTQRMSCNPSTPKIPLNIKGVTERFLGGNETALQTQITNYGPVIVAMHATRNLVQYKSGVYTDTVCPTGPAACDSVNHAVIVVGFGTDPVYGDYWKVKNSWGTTWGEDGYFRIARNKGNHCNMACWSIMAT